MSDLMVEDISEGNRLFTFQQPAESGYYYIVARAPDLGTARGMVADESRALKGAKGSIHSLASEGYELNALKMEPEMYDSLLKSGIACVYHPARSTKHPKDYWG
jgi:hypothetical protein